MNIKLFVEPKWREVNHKKWMSRKDFLTKISYRDKTWDKIQIYDEKNPEPYLEE